MGLDMYLTRRIFVGANYDHTRTTGSINIEQSGKPMNIPLNKVSEIILDEGYWRKENHIHKWFVDNVQDGNDDCKDYYVSREKLKQLLDACLKVRDNHDLAEQLLPTKSGFFFGPTEYDESYFEGIDATIKIIEEAIKDETGDLYYFSSW